MAQNRLEQLLDGIQNQDREKIINTFSENAIKESENMDESLDYLFDYFQGTVQSYECFILGKHTARNGVAGISPPRREFQKC